MILFTLISYSIAALIAVLTYATLKSMYLFWCYRHVPGPRRLPLIGSAWKFFKPFVPITQVVDITIRQSVEEFKENGFILGFAGSSKILILFNLHYVTELLKDNSLITKAKEYDYFKAWLGDGLITGTGEKWRKFRKMLNPTFHSKILEDYIPVINEQCEKLVNEIRELTFIDYVDVRPLMMNVTLNIITATAMGITLDEQSDETNEYRNCLHSVTTQLISRVYNPLYWNDFIFSILPQGRETRRQIEVLNKFSENVIKKRKQSFKPGIEFGKSKQMAFLDKLLSLQAENQIISDKDIREQVESFLFAGHDTSFVCMAYTLLLLGNYERVQNKLIEELHSIFGDNKERQVNMEDINRMHYTECVIKESLRLFPPVPYVGRTITNTFQVDGHLFDKGTSVLLSIRDALSDETVYKEPNNFLPERFMENSFQGMYLPFALGPRNCIGQRFAMIEMKIIISQIFRNFTIKCKHHVEDVKSSADVTAKPITPIFVKFKTIT